MIQSIPLAGKIISWNKMLRKYYENPQKLSSTVYILKYTKNCPKHNLEQGITLLFKCSVKNMYL